MLDLTILWAAELVLGEIHVLVYTERDNAPALTSWCSKHAPVYGPGIVSRYCTRNRSHIGPHACSGSNEQAPVCWDD